MLIAITAPVFKCEDDKHIFLSRLYAIPNYEDVSKKGNEWHLTLTEKSNQLAVEELQEICAMWGTSFKILTQ